MAVLLHTCCAVCLDGPLADLRAGGQDVLPFFYNPNIQPLLEFRKRLKAFRVLGQALKIPVEFDETYDLDLFFGAVLADLKDRCRHCYRLRLRASAQRAAQMGAHAFASTLATSPHQKHGLLREEGERAGAEFDVPFLYRDWRHLHQANVVVAKQRSLYRQQYCGCLWSEEERYRNTGKELYREPI